MSQNNRRPSAAYTPNVRRPSRRLPVDRGVMTFLLVVLLPPVGLLVLWHQGVFRNRGRLVLTALATVEMTALVVLLTPHQELATELPLPAAPPSVTVAPEGQSLNALYNIEELIYEQQLAQVVDQQTPDEDQITEGELLASQMANNEEILNTVVYSVYNGARYYHAVQDCGTQHNGRELTIREAVTEALAPCPNCNPPYVQ